MPSIRRKPYCLTTPNLEYCLDGRNWHEFILGTTVVTMEKAGDKVYFRGDNPNGFNIGDIGGYANFCFDKITAASGNIMSIIDPTCVTKTIGQRLLFGYV